MDKNHRQDQKLYIIMYHYTRDLAHSRYPMIRGLDTGLFRRQLEFFKENFHPVTMEQVMDAVECRDQGLRKGEEPDGKPPLLLTFDDGYIDNFTYAFPMLEELGFQGSFFIPGKTFAEHKLLDVNKIHYLMASTDINTLLKDICGQMDYYRGNGEFDYPSNEELYHRYGHPNRWDDADTIFVKRMLQTALPEALRNRISSDLFRKYVGVTEEQLAHELYMTPEQIRTMKRHGMHIGVHGYDHYWLGDLADENAGLMQADIDRALETLGEFIDCGRWAMNYPYGNYNEIVLKYVKTKGACVGLTIEPGVVNLEQDDPLTLRRFDCNDFPPKSEGYR